MLLDMLGLRRAPAEMFDVHQVHNATRPGRNVAFMRDAKARMTRPVKNILSFGCSTGEECADLAEVFADARILGLDVNPDVLSRAKRFESSRIRIRPSTASILASEGPFDLIFAMSVLCFSPQTIGMDNIASLYPFHRFEGMVGTLTESLAPGGILGAYNAQYFIEDTNVGSQFVPVVQPSYPAAGWIEKCAPNGDRACRTIFHHAGRDYSWAEWDELAREWSDEERCKTGRYRQIWIEGRERNGLRPDVALWLKAG